MCDVSYTYDTCLYDVWRLRDMSRMYGVCVCDAWRTYVWCILLLYAMKQPLGTWPCDGCIWGICGRRGTLPLTHPAKGGHRHSGPLAALLAWKAFGWCQGLRSCLATCAFSLQHSVCTPRFASNELGVICACDWLLLFHLCHPPPPGNCFPLSRLPPNQIQPATQFWLQHTCSPEFPTRGHVSFDPPPLVVMPPRQLLWEITRKGMGGNFGGGWQHRGKHKQLFDLWKKIFFSILKHKCSWHT